MKHRILSFVKRIFHKYAPQEHHLKDTLLHKLVGERIFDPNLWKPTKNGILWAVTLGIVVAFSPFWGAQMVIVGLLAVLFKFNIPISLLMVWISNPLTVFFIYPFEIKLGMIVLGDDRGFPNTIPSLEALVSLLWSFIVPLCIGSAITSITMGVVAYILVQIMFKLGVTIKEHNPIHMPHMPHIKKEKEKTN